MTEPSAERVSAATRQSRRTASIAASKSHSYSAQISASLAKSTSTSSATSARHSVRWRSTQNESESVSETSLPGFVRDPCGLAVRLFRLGPVPEVALEVHDLRRRDEVDVDILGPEEGGRAEVRVHRALRVGRHDDQAAARRGAVDRGRRRRT